MKQNLKSRSSQGLGALATAVAVLVSLLIPSAQAVTYSLPGAPTNVTSYIGARGIVVKWTPSTAVTPEITGYVVSAGAGSCPIFIPAGANSIVNMPVVKGQPGGTPTVQAVNAYGFSKPALSQISYTKYELATVASDSYKSVQVLQFSDR